MRAPSATAVVRFFGEVTRGTIGALLDAVDDQVAEGAERLVLLLATPGGKVAEGLAAYHYLAGSGLEVETHNFGAVDSVGAVLYCAGQRRFASPQARFVLHPPFWEFAGEAICEAEVRERAARLRADLRSMARVLAEATGKPEARLRRLVEGRAVLHPPEAARLGLVHEVRRALPLRWARGVTVAEGEEAPPPVRVLAPAT